MFRTVGDGQVGVDAEGRTLREGGDVLVLQDTGLPSSQSACLPNKIGIIPCPGTSSPNLLACQVANRTDLNSVTPPK